ncbi:hypothetical protein ACVW0W_005464 [Bradyrhizobium sp. USDA 4469]
MPGDLGGRGLRPDHRLGLVVGACGGGEQQIEIGDRLLDRVEQFDLFQNVVGAGGGALCRDVGPAVARVDDAQGAQGKVAHGACGHADVFAELRLDQDHDGTVEGEPNLGLVGAGHLIPLSASAFVSFRFGKTPNLRLKTLIQSFIRGHPPAFRAAQFLERR